MSKFVMVAGDGGTKLRVTVTDLVTKQPIDLTGKTVRARYSLNGAATVTKSMTVLNQATLPGQAEYLFLTTDVTAGGMIDGEIRLQDGQTDQLTSVETFHIAVKTPLP